MFNVFTKIPIRITIWLLDQWFDVCETSDLDDFADEPRKGTIQEMIISNDRCIECRVYEAKKTLEYILSL